MAEPPPLVVCTTCGYEVPYPSRATVESGICAQCRTDGGHDV